MVVQQYIFDSNASILSSTSSSLEMRLASHRAISVHLLALILLCCEVGSVPSDHNLIHLDTELHQLQILQPSKQDDNIELQSCSTVDDSSSYQPLVLWGLTLPSDATASKCDEGGECLDYEVARLVVTSDDNCRTVTWTTHELEELKDCINLLGHWYGGGQHYNQPWPVETHPLDVEIPFVTVDILGKRLNYGGVSERFWVSSKGIAVRVDDTIPLFLTMPDNDSDGIADQMCLSTKYKEPYVAGREDSPLQLSYHLCFADDVRQVYEKSYDKFFQYPKDIPDERMFTHPIWSTWAEFKTDVNDQKVIDFAKKIQDKGFSNSQVEIDDNWETCYGDHTFDPEKFPDPKGMVDTLHQMGYRVTLWIHPFINQICSSFSFADENGFFVKDELGQTQLTSWWQGQEAGLIDFTNKDAVSWWTERLQNLKETLNLDSFKFDAGETSYMPKKYALHLNKSHWPNGFSASYVKSVSKFGKMIEIRVGQGTQEEPVFMRLLDKDSRWGEDNGLRSMIPSLLHSGLVGYPFVLPDMVGVNGYGITPTPELFARWAQVNTFMPTIQFSILPWNFDDESIDVTEISRDVSALHAKYAPVIIELARNATLGLGPMMRPTWWLCPHREECLTASQQFLLGDDILVTPVVYEGATSVNVVFPYGTWKQADSGALYEGPATVTISGVSVNSNIYFTRLK